MPVDRIPDEAAARPLPEGARYSDALLREAASGASGVFAVRVVGAALGYALHVALARLLGAAEFGVWAFAFTLVIVAGHAASGGFAESVVRYLTDYLARGDWARARGQIVAGACAALGGGAALGLACAALLHVFRDAAPPGALAPFLVACAILPAFALQDWLDGACRAIGRPLLATAPIFVFRPVAILGAAAIAASTDDGVDAALVMGATFAGVLVAALVQAAAFWRALPAQVREARATFEWSLWARASAPVGLVVLADLAGGFADVIALGVMGQPEETGPYFAAARIIGLVGIGAFAVSAISGRRLALHQAQGERAEMQAFLRTSTRWTFLASVGLVLALAPGGPLLLSLFGRDFVSAAPALAILALGFLARAASGQADELLIILGHQRASARIAVTCALFALACAFPAAKIFGPVGVACVMTFAAALRSFLLVRAARRLTGFNPTIGRDTFAWFR